MTRFRLALLPALALTLTSAAPPPPNASEVMGCQLPYAQAKALMAQLPPGRVINNGQDRVYITTIFDPAGTVVLGHPATALVRNVTDKWPIVSRNFAARIDVTYDEAKALAFARYGKTKCRNEEQAEDGIRICLMHVGRDKEGARFDIDFQIVERGGRVQLECIYANVEH